MSIKFSVIIPVYNTESYLPECLDSIINQSFRNIEIVVVDDGSTDNCPSILRKYSSEDERIKIIRQQNKGLSGARNTGIRAAKGEYLCFVDSDDYLCDDALQIMYDNICDSYIEALCFNAHVFYETPEAERKRNLTEYFTRKADYSEIKSGRELFAAMAKNNEYCAPVWLMAVKRSWMLDNNIFFEEGIIHEDEKYSLQCYMNAEHIRYINNRLYMYRIREGSLAIGEPSCHKLYSLMVSFQYMLQVLGMYRCKDDLYFRLVEYVQNFAKRIKRLNDVIPQKEKLQYEVEDPLIDILFQNMKLGRYDNEFLNEGFYIKGFLQQLKEAGRIIIYGAGEIGQLVYQYCAKHELKAKIEAFAVTKLTQREDTTLQVPIYEISHLADLYADDEKTLLIIAGGKKILGEMLEKSEAVGFSNIVPLDEIIKAQIRSELDDSK